MCEFLRSARYPKMPRFFLQYLREVWPMPLALMNHSALALFAQRTRIPTSARSIGFCVIWVCIGSSSSSSSSSSSNFQQQPETVTEASSQSQKAQKVKRGSRLATSGLPALSTSRASHSPFTPHHSQSFLHGLHGPGTEQ